MDEDDWRKVLGLSYFQVARLWIGWGPMKEILVKLWTDPAYFVGACRFLAISLAGAILNGTITLPQPYETWIWNLAPWLAAIAAGVPAGQTNRTPEATKQIANDPGVIADPKPPTSPPGM